MSRWNNLLTKHGSWLPVRDIQVEGISSVEVAARIEVGRVSLNLRKIITIWGWVFPYISRIHTAYIGEDSSILGTWKVWWNNDEVCVIFSDGFCTFKRVPSQGTKLTYPTKREVRKIIDSKVPVVGDMLVPLRRVVYIVGGSFQRCLDVHPGGRYTPEN